MDTTHEVFNQPTPLVDYNLFDTNRPLRDALKLNAPALLDKNDTVPIRGSSIIHGADSASVVSGSTHGPVTNRTLSLHVENTLCENAAMVSKSDSWMRGSLISLCMILESSF